jgi:hypothetical protein
MDAEYRHCCAPATHLFNSAVTIKVKSREKLLVSSPPVTHNHTYGFSRCGYSILTYFVSIAMFFLARCNPALFIEFNSSSFLSFFLSFFFFCGTGV